MTDTFRALCAELANELRLYKVAHPNHDASLIDRAFALLNPHPGSAATNLAARPLLEKVARMADCIDQRTVSEIIAISNQAEAWLNGNPPGQPVAIEPRGCPTPGACSCVEPAAQPEPVPVSERLPGPGDCDGEGRCWIFMPDIGTDPSWRLTDPRDIGPYHTHSLPHYALPTPEPTNA
jgi:hypothetical protein